VNVSNDPQYKTGALRLGGLTVDFDSYLAKDGGSVGIGTDVPTEKLTVDGSINVTAGNDICIDGGNCLSTAGGVSGGWNSSGSAVVHSGNLEPNTWNKLDLSPIVGSREVLLFLKVKCISNMNQHITLKPYSDPDTYANDWGGTIMNQVQTGFADTYYLLMVSTDSDGCIGLNPWAFVNNWEIKLVGYID